MSNKVQEKPLDPSGSIEEAGESTTGNVEIAPRKVEPSLQASPDIPNGGINAWSQVLGSFFLFFNNWGIVSSFGVFQTYYELELLSTKSASQISWIGSIQAFLLLLIGVLVGPLHDHGHFRALIFTGCFSQVFGMMMLSLCTQYWQAILAQGVVVGIGCGCVFIPSVAILPTYFSTKRGLANGIASSGSGLGSVVFPIIFRQLQPSIGFGWATRVIAFVMLGTSLIPLVLMKMRIPPSSAKKKKFDGSAFKELPYLFWVIGAFIMFLGFYTPFFYIPTYALAKNITKLDPFYLLPILSAGSIFGRILPSLVIDRTGVLNMVVPCAFFLSLLGFVWISVHDTAGIIVFCLFYGFISGLFLSLPSITAVSLSPNLGVVGVRMGMCFSIGSLGLLIGQPIAGAIVKSSWIGLQVWTGATMGIASLLLMGTRVAKVGWDLRVKA